MDGEDTSPVEQTCVLSSKTTRPGFLKRCTNLYSFLLPFLLFLIAPRLKPNEGCWRNFRGICSRTDCGRLINQRSGVFCANYSFRRGIFPACNNCWCDKCYTGFGGQVFQMRKAMDEDGNVLDEEEDRFLHARPGDNLMTPFQCETCHFRNIVGRDPSWDAGLDVEAMMFMRRCSLDAFWAREPTTVWNNLSEASRGERSMHRFGFPLLTPPMGPFPNYNNDSTL